MSSFRGEFSAQESFDNLARQGWSDDPLPDAQDVHIVMLDSLGGGIGVVTNPGAQAWMFIDGDAYPDPASADQDPSLRLALHQGLRHQPGEVGIVVLPIKLKRPYVQDLVTTLAEMLADEFFKFESGVVAADRYLQGLPFRPAQEFEAEPLAEI